jgi:hypothetical protein
LPICELLVTNFRFGTERELLKPDFLTDFNNPLDQSGLRFFVGADDDRGVLGVLIFRLQNVLLGGLAIALEGSWTRSSVSASEKLIRIMKNAIN